MKKSSGPGGVEVNIKADLRAIDLDLRVMHPKLVRAAQVSTINKIVTKIKGKAVTKIAKAAGRMPRRLLLQRSRRVKANKNTLTGKAIIFLQPMPAQAQDVTGTYEQGLRINEGRLVGAFRGTARRGKSQGKRSIWERIGGSQYPIKKTTTDIEQHGPLMGPAGDLVVSAQFKKILHKELARRLKKYAGTS